MKMKLLLILNLSKCSICSLSWPSVFLHWMVFHIANCEVKGHCDCWSFNCWQYAAIWVNGDVSEDCAVSPSSLLKELESELIPNWWQGGGVVCVGRLQRIWLVWATGRGEVLEPYLAQQEIWNGKTSKTGCKSALCRTTRSRGKC
jgi:hypothetical protein